MGCSTLLGEKGGGKLGQNMNGPLLQELAVGNSIHLNLIRDSQKRGGGGSTHNTRWSERRLKIATDMYTISYKYTQLRMDGNTYYRHSLIMQSCNIQQCHTHHNHAIYNIPLPVGVGFNVLNQRNDS